MHHVSDCTTLLLLHAQIDDDSGGGVYDVTLSRLALQLYCSASSCHPVSMGGGGVVAFAPCQDQRCLNLRFTPLYVEPNRPPF
jgi:hypothetical protein